MRKVFQPISVARWAKENTKIVAGIAAGLLVGGAGSAVVLASVPDSNGVVHGCFRTNNGSLRIIDDAVDTCTANETAISWNQTGPQGPAGPQGPQGQAGNSGQGSFLSNLVGAEFTEADLQYRNFAGTDLHAATFDGVSLTGSDFTGANMKDTVFMSSAYAFFANFTDTDFTGSHQTRTYFHNANLTNTNFTNTNFFSSSFINSDLSTANLAGVTWNNVTCPDGTNSDNNGSTCAGHLVP